MNNNQSDETYKQFITKKRMRIASIALVIAMLVIALSVFGYKRYILGAKDTNESENKVVETIPFSTDKQPVSTDKASPINGAILPKEQADKYPLAVVIENHPEARPQSGMVRASAVYEAIAEGGITRFLAIFGPHQASEVGPVRSARTFFIDWASEYKAYFAHAGGAPDALDQIPKSPIFDLPHTKGYFERKNRGGVAYEHTLYTSTDNLYKLASAKGYPESFDITSLKHKDDASLEQRGSMTAASINYQSAQYNIRWNYNKNDNNYGRVMGGVDHKDRITGEQIKAKTVIVQEVSRQAIQLPGAKPTYRFTTTGSGKAIIFQDGHRFDGTWKKDSQKSRTVFLDSEGKDIEINRGMIWYNIIPPGYSVTNQ